MAQNDKGQKMSVSENTKEELLTMREVRNVNTGRVKLVPHNVAEAVRKQKHFIKQGWVIVEHSEPPYEVIQFQESKKAEPPVIVKPVIIEPPVVSITDTGLKVVTSDPGQFDSQKLTVKRVAQRLNEFSRDELMALAADPRKSVAELANRRLSNWQEVGNG